MKSPDQISGLVGWWHGNNVTLSGSNVTAWPDNSSEGHDLTATGTPTWDATNKGVVFPGSTGTFLARLDSLGLGVVANPAMTIASRIGDRTDAIDVLSRWLHVGSNTGATGTALHLGNDFSSRYEDGAKVWGSNPVDAAAYDNYIFAHPAAGDYDASDLYYNGALATPTSAGSPNTVSMSDGAFMLGAADGTTTTTYSSGLTIKEVAAFNRVLTAQEIADLNDYLDSETMGTLSSPSASGRIRGRPSITGLRGRPWLARLGR